MANSTPTLPPLLAQVCARFPRAPGAWLFVAGLNTWLRPHLPDDIRTQLAGRLLRVQVLDTQWVFDYTWNQQGFEAVYRPAVTPDLCLSATLWDFYQLLRRDEDPDTLFFHRRLRIEGDTELGLMVKNTMDAIDLSELGAQQLWRATLARLGQKARGRFMPAATKQR
ncbi:ubiquinone anaerobic biosynthesis accessory factor UbiT [Alcaligenes endophyticus]|uniref:Ubiquinone biosynthesis accessory factor UbiT n=1 Tax=Alcaligenes endophyticus TaxID=1929088 RepID=A0ABT8ELG2_9BURK|nr:SCP2 sterol-binding domain-containing protein [Alcaligenes endophyticus]MCX5591288.1 SCP2 sterol-binding domain-containing protein [Alcaligenes endophyticus]MDN4122136.1 SCP2 sterol-binding domain-containing protein [Alcaligenes endophyticus]